MLCTHLKMWLYFKCLFLPPFCWKKSVDLLYNFMISPTCFEERYGCLKLRITFLLSWATSAIASSANAPPPKNSTSHKVVFVWGHQVESVHCCKLLQRQEVLVKDETVNYGFSLFGKLTKVKTHSDRDYLFLVICFIL